MGDRMNTTSLTWEIARAGGFTAYGLLSASVAIGLVVSLKWRSARWTRYITTELHRFVTLLSLVFIAIHTLTVAVDSFIQFSLPEILVPFVSHYRTLWIAAGIVSSYLLIAVYLSEQVRPFVGYAWWRRFHALSFGAFALALVHGIASGSDTKTPWAIAIYGGSVAIVGALILVRAFPPTSERSHPIPAAIVILALALGGFWAWSGPLQPGWNAIANDGHGSGGTVPAAAAASAGPSGPSAAPTDSPGPAQPFADTISGQLLQADDGSFQLTATLASSHDRLTLRFPSGQAGRLAIRGATVRLVAPDGDTCTGSIAAARGNELSASCQGATSGAVWDLSLSLTSDPSGFIQGSIEAQPH
jgi:hypothetical protein